MFFSEEKNQKTFAPRACTEVGTRSDRLGMALG
jgi:hypothetical protein